MLAWISSEIPRNAKLESDPVDRLSSGESTGLQLLRGELVEGIADSAYTLPAGGNRVTILDGNRSGESGRAALLKQSHLVGRQILDDASSRSPEQTLDHERPLGG